MTWGAIAAKTGSGMALLYSAGLPFTVPTPAQSNRPHNWGVGHSVVAAVEALIKYSTYSPPRSKNCYLHLGTPERATPVATSEQSPLRRQSAQSPLRIPRRPSQRSIPEHPKRKKRVAAISRSRH